jgi:DeoR family fructose operon transcriptional repressor
MRNEGERFTHNKSHSIMVVQERFQFIIDSLARRQKMTVHELQEELNVSLATLRRDITELEAAGKIVRVRGAVVHPGYFRKEPSLTQKSRTAVGAKRAIAAAAAELVPSGATVMIDAGSTCLALGQLLLSRADLTIITHSLPLATVAHESGAAATVISIGGEVRAVSGATVGALALSWLQSLRADWCFLGASGLSATEGASTTELSEAAMKQEMLRRAKHKVLLADGKKWNTPATVLFASWDNFDTWITGTDISENDARAVQKQGLRVIRTSTK